MSVANDSTIAASGQNALLLEVSSPPGLTLRDYFAAKAMQSMLRVDTDNGRFRNSDIAERTADFSYVVSDAMLKAREAQS